MAETISPTTQSDKTPGRTKGVGRIIVMFYAILALDRKSTRLNSSHIL